MVFEKRLQNYKVKINPARDIPIFFSWRCIRTGGFNCLFFCLLYRFCFGGVC